LLIRLHGFPAPDLEPVLDRGASEKETVFGVKEPDADGDMRLSALEAGALIHNERIKPAAGILKLADLRRHRRIAAPGAIEPNLMVAGDEEQRGAGCRDRFVDVVRPQLALFPQRNERGLEEVQRGLLPLPVEAGGYHEEDTLAAFDLAIGDSGEGKG